MIQNDKTRQRIYAMSLATVYPFYIIKAEKKGRAKEEVDQIICWLMGFTQTKLKKELDQDTNFETLFTKASKLHPNRNLITGMICRVRVEDIKDPVVKGVRQMDKLIDELAHGKPMEKILRH